MEIRTIDFSTANTVGNNFTLADGADGSLELSGSTWGTGAVHTLEETIRACDIVTMTIRCKSSDKNFGAAILYFNGSDTVYYLNPQGISDDSVIGKFVDSAGYTVLTLDFGKYLEKVGDMLHLKSIYLKSNSASFVASYDYISFELTTMADRLLRAKEDLDAAYQAGYNKGYEDGLNAQEEI